MLRPAQKSALKVVVSEWKSALDLKLPQAPLMALAAKGIIQIRKVNDTFEFRKVM